MIFFYKTHSFGDEVVDSWRSNAAFARSVATRCEEKRKQKILLALEKKFSKSGQEDVDVDKIKQEENTTFLPCVAYRYRRGISDAFAFRYG